MQKEFHLLTDKKNSLQMEKYIEKLKGCIIIPYDEGFQVLVPWVALFLCRREVLFSSLFRNLLLSKLVYLDLD